MKQTFRIFFSVTATLALVIAFVLFAAWLLLPWPLGGKPSHPPPTPHFAPRYTITGIAMVPSSYGHLAINQSGDIVGAVETKKVQKDCCGNAYPILHAALWHQGTMTDLGSLGPSESEATGINRSGQVIGLYDGDRGFLWTQGKMQDLGTLGGLNCTPKAINDSGQIVGCSDIARKTFNSNGQPGDAISHAFVWANGHMTDLTSQVGNVGPDQQTNATAINDAGLIVGEVDVNGTLWDHGRVSHPNMDYITAVNAHGHYAGDSLNQTVLVAGRHIQKIGNAEGYGSGLTTEGSLQVRTMNASDQIVGVEAWNSGRAQAEGGQGWAKSSGFLWRAGKTWDLNSLIPANSGWELEDAQSINDSGWIVGIGKYKGKEQAFLLKPLLG